MGSKQEKGISIFFPFRSFHNQQFNRNVYLFFLLPPLFNILLLCMLNVITTIWGGIWQFFLLHMGYPYSVGYDTFQILHLTYHIPFISISAGAPDGYLWWKTLVASGLIFVLSIFISDAYTPLKYFLRGFIFLILTALVYFLISPTTFPYDIAIYTKTGMLMIIVLMFATPWIYCLTYYVFGYRVIRKILTTLFLIAYLVILAPFQYLINALVIHAYSLLFMPALYIYFGLLIDIFIIVAIYAYGVSKEQILRKY